MMKSLISNKTQISQPLRLFSTKITRSLPVKDQSLKEHDPELYKLLELEKKR
jgi:hypothetical protein